MNCSVSGCESPVRTRGMCQKHYLRSWRHGDPNTVIAESRSDPVSARLARKVRVAENGCHLWTGRTLKNGYGLMQINRKQLLVHRVAYELAHGPLSAGVFACHKCDTPNCVNPAHLFAGTPKDNMQDMTAKGRHRPGGQLPKGIR